MYRVVKVLNHNAVLAVEAEGSEEYLLMGKGIGFGKKVSERMEPGNDCRVYKLQQCNARGEVSGIIKSTDPEFLEIANLVLDEAERVFGHIDRNIMFSLADHIFYAVGRMKKREQISNPLTEDIRLLFHMEYKVASCAIPILKERFDVDIGDDEVGYIALHVHSAIEDENVSDAMKTAQAVRECVGVVEKALGRQIDVTTLSYNRLMNHVRYMIVRAMKDEELKMSLNDYISVRYPEAYAMSEDICGQIGKIIGKTLKDAELGYMAIHICRVMNNELDEEEAM